MSEINKNTTFSVNLVNSEYLKSFGPDSEFHLDQMDAYELASTKGLSGSPIRSIYWRLFLGYFEKNSYPNRWIECANKHRTKYEELLKEYVTNPNDDGGDPFCVTGTDSKWAQYYKDNDLREVIKKDLTRTHQDNDLFTSTTTQDMLMNVLFVWCKLHPEYSYRQGMNELISVLYFVLTNDCYPDTFTPPVKPVLHLNEEGVDLVTDSRSTDSSLLALYTLINPVYIEHDLFYLFSALMSVMAKYYAVPGQNRDNSVSYSGVSSLKSKDKAEYRNDMQIRYGGNNNSLLISEEPPITKASSYIFNTLLPLYDRHLHQHLVKNDVVPTLFLLRWIRLIFSRELDLPSVCVLWDCILANTVIPSDGDKWNVEKNGVEMIDYIALTLIIRVRNELLEGDDSSLLSALLSYDTEDLNLNDVITKAHYLKANKKPLMFKSQQSQQSHQSQQVQYQSNSNLPSINRSRPSPRTPAQSTSSESQGGFLSSMLNRINDALVPPTIVEYQQHQQKQQYLNHHQQKQSKSQSSQGNPSLNTSLLTSALRYVDQTHDIITDISSELHEIVTKMQKIAGLPETNKNEDNLDGENENVGEVAGNNEHSEPEDILNSYCLVDTINSPDKKAFHKAKFAIEDSKSILDDIPTVFAFAGAEEDVNEDDDHISSMIVDLPVENDDKDVAKDKTGKKAVSKNNSKKNKNKNKNTDEKDSTDSLNEVDAALAALDLNVDGEDNQKDVIDVASLLDEDNMDVMDVVDQALSKADKALEDTEFLVKPVPSNTDDVVEPVAQAGSEVATTTIDTTVHNSVNSVVVPMEDWLLMQEQLYLIQQSLSMVVMLPADVSDALDQQKEKVKEQQRLEQEEEEKRKKQLELEEEQRKKQLQYEEEQRLLRLQKLHEDQQKEALLQQQQKLLLLQQQKMTPPSSTSQLRTAPSSHVPSVSPVASVASATPTFITADNVISSNIVTPQNMSNTIVASRPTYSSYSSQSDVFDTSDLFTFPSTLASQPSYTTPSSSLSTTSPSPTSPNPVFFPISSNSINIDTISDMHDAEDEKISKQLAVPNSIFTDDDYTNDGVYRTDGKFNAVIEERPTVITPIPVLPVVNAPPLVSVNVDTETKENNDNNDTPTCSPQDEEEAAVNAAVKAVKVNQVLFEEREEEKRKAVNAKYSKLFADDDDDPIGQIDKFSSLFDD